MATWTSIYVETDNVKSLIEKVSELTDNLIITFNNDFPYDIGDYYLFDEDLPPNYLAIGQTQNNWTTIVHNSFDKFEDWGITISRQFNGKLIVTIAQSVSESYYFSLYEKGEKVREIETCYSSDFEEVNFGNKLEFELENSEDKTDFFDFDSIESYCQKFGLTIQTDYQKSKWAVLKAQNLKKESFIENFVKSKTQKPWWKFW